MSAQFPDPARHVGIAVALARKCEARNNLPTGDQIGKAYIHLAESAKRWNPKYGSAFSTFAYANTARSLPRDHWRDRNKWAAGDGGASKDDGEQRRLPRTAVGPATPDLSRFDWAECWDALEHDQREAVGLIQRGTPLKTVAELMWKTPAEVVDLIRAAMLIVDPEMGDER